MTIDDELLAALALTIPCARCEAKVKQRCVSVTGGKAGMHAARVEPIDRAYGLGYADGVTETTQSLNQAGAE